MSAMTLQLETNRREMFIPSWTFVISADADPLTMADRIKTVKFKPTV
jgi:hypothetical protein